MRLFELFSDLRFVIGLFLSLIGVLVLCAYFFGGADSSQGIHVNLLGGGMLTITGIALLLSSRFGDQSNAS